MPRLYTHDTTLANEKQLNRPIANALACHNAICFKHLKFFPLIFLGCGQIHKVNYANVNSEWTLMPVKFLFLEMLKYSGFLVSFSSLD